MATASLPQSIATALAGGEARSRMPLSRALRSTAAIEPLNDAASVANRNTPMADMVELAQSIMKRASIPTFEIVFSSDKAPGQSFRALPVLGAPASLKPMPFEWMKNTPACCLHCGESIVGVPFFAVVQRLKTGRLEPAPALFCNQGPAYCNLAWLEDEYKGPERGNAVSLTRDAMARYLGVEEPMHRAPPRVALAKYSHVGKGMDVASFHGQPDANGCTTIVAALMQPPLVTYAAVLECRTLEAAVHAVHEDQPVVAFANSMGRVRGLTRPKKRDTSVAEVHPTCKPPLILSFIAAKSLLRKVKGKSKGKGKTRVKAPTTAV